MVYKKGSAVISVEKVEGFGKNPGLYIGTVNDKKNEFYKVASFGSDDKAKTFCKWFEYFMGLEKEENALN